MASIHQNHMVDGFDAANDAAEAHAARQEHLIERAAARWSQNVYGVDLSEQLDEVRDLLNDLAAQGKAELIGRVVIAVRQDYIDALARREVMGAAFTESSNPLAAAQKVLAADAAPVSPVVLAAMASICPVPAFPSLRGGL